MKVCNENTAGAIGWCLDPLDIAYSKLVARREKDVVFVTELLRHKLIRPSAFEELIAGTPDDALRTRLADSWTIRRRDATARE